MTYVDTRGAGNEVIDIKPHAPYGSKAARKAAKERAAERFLIFLSIVDYFSKE